MACTEPCRATLRAVGMIDDDWNKPQVGIASTRTRGPLRVSAARLVGGERVGKSTARSRPSHQRVGRNVDHLVLPRYEDVSLCVLQLLPDRAGEQRLDARTSR